MCWSHSKENGGDAIRNPNGFDFKDLICAGGETTGLKRTAIHEDGNLYMEHTVSRVKSTIAKDRTKTDASQRSYPVPCKIRDELSKIRDKAAVWICDR